MVHNSEVTRTSENTEQINSRLTCPVRAELSVNHPGSVGRSESCCLSAALGNATPAAADVLRSPLVTYFLFLTSSCTHRRPLSSAADVITGVSINRGKVPVGLKLAKCWLGSASTENSSMVFNFTDSVTRPVCK